MESLRHLQILLADDSKPMRILVREMLAALGLPRCCEAAGVDDAVEILEQIPVDMVITDIMMGDGDGLAIVRRVRAGVGATDPMIPIVVISGHSELSSVQAARQAGADTFIAKPISAATLAQHIGYVLRYCSSGEPRLREIQRRLHWRTDDAG